MGSTLSLAASASSPAGAIAAGASLLRLARERILSWSNDVRSDLDLVSKASRYPTLVWSRSDLRVAANSV